MVKGKSLFLLVQGEGKDLSLIYLNFQKKKILSYHQNDEHFKKYSQSLRYLLYTNCDLPPSSLMILEY